MALTKKEQNFVESFMRLGVTRGVATVLVYLKGKQDVKSVEIERATELRQPEVSLALSRMHQEGWTMIKPMRTVGKGRPVLLYTLKRDFWDIVQEKLDFFGKVNNAILTDMHNAIDALQPS